MLTRPPEVHTDGHKPTSNGEYLRCTPLVQKNQAQSRTIVRLVSVTNIGTDVSSLTKTWHSKSQVPCPHCEKSHKYKVSEAFAEAAISDERIRGGFLASWA
jgi:hypothetical protein